MKRLMLFIPCLALTACVYSQHSSQHNKGSNPDPQSVARIEAGKTNKQWVLTNLGIPDRTQAEKDGLEVFEYINERTETSNKTFIFLFDIDSNKTLSKKVTRVVMRDGIVENVNTSDI